ncbi:MAG: hypothetical protein A3K66_05260 [Euryarchaeota archaeon RBG_16_67_27]|nr:MAG: hypothetical protein A3K66_05260 [Euryarchaeota archaeon RBG_16_67_27]
MLSLPYLTSLKATDVRRVPAGLAAYARLEYGEADAAWLSARTPTPRKRPAAGFVGVPRQVGRLRRLARAVGSFLL